MSLYLESSKIIARVNYGGLRAAVYSDRSIKSKPEQLYALCVETLKHQEILNEVIEKSQILKVEKKLTHPLALVLLHDFLISKNGIATSNGPLKSSILRNRARLSAEFTRARLKRGFSTKAALLARSQTQLPRFPRWVRINNLKANYDLLMNKGVFSEFTPIDDLEKLYPKRDYLPNKVYVDPYVADLLAFAPSAPLLKHPLKKTGAIVFQDRASCVPAQLLDPPRDAYVVDATAAPGNKTTHLASLLGPDSKGKIFAFERDRRRVFALKEAVAAAGAQNLVEIRPSVDFLRSAPWNPSEENGLKKVTHILLDPSCSGSGIVERDEYRFIPTGEPGAKGTRHPDRSSIKGTNTSPSAVEYEDAGPGWKSATEDDRLFALADFQVRIIEHAMRFPNATRITYSTCSVHAQENERVVMAALNTSVARHRGWVTEPRHLNRLKDWPRRGIVEECDGNEQVADSCIRFRPWTDGGIGFFVAVFIRNEQERARLPRAPVIRWDLAEKARQERSATAERLEEEEEEWKGISDNDLPTEPSPGGLNPAPIRYYTTLPRGDTNVAEPLTGSDHDPNCSKGPNIIRGGLKPKKKTQREKQREKQQARAGGREEEEDDIHGSWAEVFEDDLEYVSKRAKSIVKRNASVGNLDRLKDVRMPLEDFDKRDFSQLQTGPNDE
ncbi:S-adenosyl-L-methionine-dependent methyltransferase [Tuber magnatum]|uniref:S-adenosyl-L-methionine-dependent methyltransferase n=1 Tax=Tuber magnatum TaxID=42249 RepID=A0A317T0A8_9PEZI|nr:S-adenosyl-L-methionine-dependent methyltransferase [Tuber magnatum]